MKRKWLFLLLTLLLAETSSANKADVVAVKATQQKDQTWRFDVTLKHADEGWDHYANEWIVLSPDDKILAKRTLYHPHVNEQPFTRNIQGVKIPENINKIRIVAHDSVHGFGDKSMEVDLLPH